MTGMEFYFTPKGEVMITDECGTRQLEQSIGSLFPKS